ncbi:MAG: associated domain protein, partial [Ramlibacter sp.]|nr:associated domain protein [Ramlibacter sp.]
PLWQQRQRAADLLAVASKHGDFPILLETYRECLRDVFDLPALIELMTAVRARTVRVVSVDTTSPSPFAQSLAFQYVANFLYEGDAPLAERRAQALTLDRDMLAELLGTEELRELIHPEALDALEANLQALDERWWARDPDEASDLLRRLGDLTAGELRARSTGDFAGALLADRRAVEIRVAGEARLIAVEDAGRYRDALGVHPPPGLPDVFLAPVTDPLGSLLGRFARTHGPFRSDEPARRFGLPVGVAEALLAARADAGVLLRGEFRPGESGQEWCDAEVLRQLRQRSLAALRKEVEPVDAGALAGFLPAWQGVGSDGPSSVQRIGGLDRLFEVVGQLQGVAVPASVLERDVLSARVGDYSPRMLDELAAAGEVVWVGAGPLGRDDGKVLLFLRGKAALLRPPPQAERPAGPEHDRLREVLDRRGACFPASPMCPSTNTSSAPNTRIVSRIGLGVVAGAYTRTGSCAAAPYAASAAPAFPAVGVTNPGTPSARARVTAALIPRALNEAVGLSPSSFTHSRATPISRASAGASCIGVSPSPSETGASSASSGSTGEYRHMSQRGANDSRDGNAES